MLPRSAPRTIAGCFHSEPTTTRAPARRKHDASPSGSSLPSSSPRKSDLHPGLARPQLDTTTAAEVHRRDLVALVRRLILIRRVEHEPGDGRVDAVEIAVSENTDDAGADAQRFERLAPAGCDDIAGATEHGPAELEFRRLALL